MIDPKVVTPYEQLGGEEKVRDIARRFYDAMETHEPALAAVHRLTAEGKVHPDARENFALFFIGWLGGPQTYVERHGHPRLRMRHAKVAVTTAMRDAWMRAMGRALDECEVRGEIRGFLEQRLGEVADFMRNTPDG